MIEEVRTCICARTDFFGKYVVVPPALQPELGSFLEKINALGENCTGAEEFEQQFQASGLMDVFNSLVTRCTPQNYQMTAEDRAYSRQVSKEIFQEDKNRILKEAGEELLESVQMKAESDLMAARRCEMADKGVLDDYTRATNYVEDAGIISRFLKGKFGKKK